MPTLDHAPRHAISTCFLAMRQPGPILAALLGVIFFAGCCSSRYPDEGDLGGTKVYLPGTSAYKEQVAKLKLTPADAQAAEARVGSPQLVPGVIVGHFYVFSMPEKDHWRLEGMYVDGDGGGVRYIDTKYIVKKDLLGNPCVTLP